MKQRTPLTKVLDWVEENEQPYDCTFDDFFVIPAKNLRAFIESIKEEEKENIQRAYVNGIEAEADVPIGIFKINPNTPNSYFNQTFEQ